jgi:proton-dependent oligopeptide transporter, POT family
MANEGRNTTKVSLIAEVPASTAQAQDFGKPQMPAPQDDDLPTNVSTAEQLKDLPQECLSGIADRPLRHVDEDGNTFTYSLNPMTYSVIFILMVELLERFCFYGVNYTQTAFLTGSYNEDWNAEMTSVEASSYVSISVAVAYTTPFLGAFLADSLLGDYYGLLVGAVVFYLPGLTLIALTTIPKFLGSEFNNAALAFGLIFLWPTGTGIVKSIVNVFGAKQFHPLLQSSLIESYYVSFYMCINIGALIGGVLVPFLAQSEL